MKIKELKDFAFMGGGPEAKRTKSCRAHGNFGMFVCLFPQPFRPYISCRLAVLAPCNRQFLPSLEKNQSCWSRLRLTRLLGIDFRVPLNMSLFLQFCVDNSIALLRNTIHSSPLICAQ